MNKENLQRMVDYLKSGAVPQEKFDMICYHPLDNEIRSEENYTWIQEHICETAGCVIGHCINLDTDLFKKQFHNASNGLIKGVFTRWSEEFTGLSAISKLWNFMFSGEWDTLDNTIKGAITRIEAVINDCPEKHKDWNDFMEEIYNNQ